MCRIYNIVGSLSAISEQLKRHQISEFSTIDELIQFQKKYSYHREQLINKHEVLIDSEKSKLKLEIVSLDEIIDQSRKRIEFNLSRVIEELKQKLNLLVAISQTGIIKGIAKAFNKWRIKRILDREESGFDITVAKELQPLLEAKQQKIDRLHFIDSNFQMAVQQSSYSSLKELERKKTVIDDLTTIIYGAIGEQTVVDTLESLSDEYILINDFKVSFATPLYWSQEKEWIKTIQIDHILISPSGVFLLETKNWSENSINNLSLRSPVLQIRRASYVLYKLLTDAIKTHQIRLNRHHWGNRIIPIRNLLIMISSCPSEEFEYVKILPLNKLKGYVRYFKPIFSNEEVEHVSNYLIKLLQLEKV